MNRSIFFDDTLFSQLKEEQGIYQTRRTTASKADMIAHATRRVITEKMDEDPAWYEKFSKLVQQAIDAFRAKRISDLEYLHTVVALRNKVVGKVHDDVPDMLSGNEDAMAYYGVLKQFIELPGRGAQPPKSDALLEVIAANAAVAINRILEKNRKVHFWYDDDARKQTVNEIDDYLYDELKKEKGIELSLDQMDALIEKVFQVARHRSK